MNDPPQKVRSKDAKAKQQQVNKKQEQQNKVVQELQNQPKICKDFAKTGYCIFGDDCIYLHIRNKAPVTKSEPKCTICDCILRESEVVVHQCGHKICLQCLERGEKECGRCGARYGTVRIE